MGSVNRIQPRVVMVVVVPPEERLKPRTRMENAGEAPRIIGLVLHGLEVRLLERVVVGDARAAETLVDTKRCEKLGQGIALHGGATIGMDLSPGSMPCRATVSANSCAARCLHSFAATIQPTT